MPGYGGATAWQPHAAMRGFDGSLQRRSVCRAVARGRRQRGAQGGAGMSAGNCEGKDPALDLTGCTLRNGQYRCYGDVADL